MDCDTFLPDRFCKWTIPAQTYLVVNTDFTSYGSLFEHIIAEYIPNHQMTLTGAVHERYPEPGNPDRIELYFPIAKGNCFCQSCGMPMLKTEDFGTEKDDTKCMDYCHYCHENGRFTTEKTMNQMIEFCILFKLQAGVYANAEQAKKAMLEIYPKLKRWAIYRCAVILESIETVGLLKYIESYISDSRVVDMPNEPEKIWHIHSYDFTLGLVEKLLPIFENGIKKGWYIHIFNKEHDVLYVVMSGKSFKLCGKRDSRWDEMISYGESVDVDRKWTEHIPLSV